MRSLHTQQQHRKRPPCPPSPSTTSRSSPAPPPRPVVARQRPVRALTTAPRGYEGEGFPVRRAFAGALLEDLDPFIHLDQMGEVEYAPGEAKGTPWHPHRGFETVTYMLDGVFEHADSNGGGGVITNGDTQWMTAGAGILHIEMPPEWLVAQGGLFHGFQLWVNLPRAQKLAAPRYQDIRAERGRPAGLARRRGAGPRDRGRGRRPRGARLHLHADHPRPHDARAGRHRRSRGAPTTTRWPMSSRAAARWGPSRPAQLGQLAVFGPGNTLTSRRTRSRRAGRRTSTCWSWAGARSGSRSPGRARS